MNRLLLPLQPEERLAVLSKVALCFGCGEEYVVGDVSCPCFSRSAPPDERLRCAQRLRDMADGYTKSADVLRSLLDASENPAGAQVVEFLIVRADAIREAAARLLREADGGSFGD